MNKPAFSLQVLGATLQQRVESHRQQWKNCTRCDIGVIACKKAFIRGELPCDVLFVGEAPGKSEDVLGLPFVGPAGRLLDQLWERRNDGRTGPKVPPLRRAIINTVACRPTDTAGGDNRQPTETELVMCRPQFEGLLRLCVRQDPRQRKTLLVALGKVAAGWLRVLKIEPDCELQHPAYILRQGGVKSEAFEKNRQLLAAACFRLPEEGVLA